MEAVANPSLIDRLKTYRADQGRYVRLTSILLITLLWAYGCWRLDESLTGLHASWMQWPNIALVNELPLFESAFKVADLTAIVAFGAGIAAAQMFLNRPKIADTLIETEAELRKITWPTFRDTASASMVVLVTVLALFMLLGLYDIMIGRGVDWLFFGRTGG